MSADKLDTPLTETELAELVSLGGMLARRLAFERDALKKKVEELERDSEVLKTGVLELIKAVCEMVDEDKRNKILSLLTSLNEHHAPPEGEWHE